MYVNKVKNKNKTGKMVRTCEIDGIGQEVKVHNESITRGKKNQRKTKDNLYGWHKEDNKKKWEGSGLNNEDWIAQLVRVPGQ